MTHNRLTLLFYFSIIMSGIFLLLSRNSINNYQRMTPTLTQNRPDNLFYKVDYCNVTPRFSIIAGWAGLSDGSIDVTTNVYAIDEDGNLHKINKTTTKRADIVKKMHKNMAFENAGFIASTATSKAVNLTNKFAIQLINHKKQSVVYYECKQ